MHIFLVGATGRTGQLVLDEALSNGHSVVALDRNSPSRLTSRSGLTIKHGNPLSAPDVMAAFDPSHIPDAVIVTLNASRASDSPFAKIVAPPTMLTDCHANLVAAMRAHGVKKIVTMSAFGVADSQQNMNWFLNLVLRKTNMAVQFADHDAVDAEMKKRKDINWVLIRPTILKEGEALLVKDRGDHGNGVSMTSSITRKSVAKWMIKAAEGEQWNKRTPVLEN